MKRSSRSRSFEPTDQAGPYGSSESVEGEQGNAEHRPDYSDYLSVQQFLAKEHPAERDGNSGVERTGHHNRRNRISLPSIRDGGHSECAYRAGDKPRSHRWTDRQRTLLEREPAADARTNAANR